MALPPSSEQTKALPDAEGGNSRAETPAPVETGFFRWVSLAGAAVLTAIAAIVPLFLLPFAWFPWFDMERAEAIVAKLLLLQFLSGIALVLGGIALLGPGWNRYRGPVLLPAAALVLYLVWGTISLVVHPAPRYGLVTWLPVLLTVGAALTGPLFLHSPQRIRVLVIAVLCAGAVAGGIGISSALGWREFNRVAYGQDPRDVFEDPKLKSMIRVQGGARSAAAISTMANPEYAGTYCAAVAALGAVVLLDWTHRWRRRWLWRGAVMGALGLLLLLLAFTGTRQPWIALSLAGLLRLCLFFRVPKRPLAAAFALFLATGLVGGGLAAIILLGVLLGVLAVWLLRRGDLLAQLRGVDRFNLTMAAGFPAVLTLLMVAYSMPGPWNPNGLRIMQRFGTLLTQNDQSYRERALMYLLASEMVHNNPVLGVGPGRYGSHFTTTLAALAQSDDTGVVELVREQLGKSIGVQAHNDYLHTAAETGVPGLVFFLSAMVFLLGGLSRIAHNDDDWHGLVAIVVMVGLTAFFSIMMTSFPLQMPERMSVFWMLVAAGLGLVARHGTQPERTA